MPVPDWMSKSLITIDEHDSIMRAARLMKANNIKHLPVMSKGRLMGIVSDRDLKEAQPSQATTLDVHEMHYLMDKVKVNHIMPKQLFTIGPRDTVEKAAAVMLKHSISALPVVGPDGQMEGIITKGDIFRAFVSISGINQAQLAMGFELEDRPGSIGEVAAVIRAHGGRLASILTTYERVPKGFRHVFIRAREVEDEAALKKELESKFKVLYFTHDRVE